jgi:hypothetical protein
MEARNFVVQLEEKRVGRRVSTFNSCSNLESFASSIRGYLYPIMSIALSFAHDNDKERAQETNLVNSHTLPLNF